VFAAETTRQGLTAGETVPDLVKIRVGADGGRLFGSLDVEHPSTFVRTHPE
jgi:hypothetical protein